jgi:hypothetical protein
MRRRISAVFVPVLVVLGLVTPSNAVFHENVINEVLTSYNGDPNVQFVEMRMLFSFQNSVQHSVFAAFDSNGQYIKDLLEVPGNVTNSGTDVRWLIGTTAFQTASGITPDFMMPTGILPSGGGMVCFGGGGGITPQNPPSWDRTNFASYVDCVAYGTFAGGSNVKIGTPTSLNADGHSLQRTGSTNNNAADFTCADPATPQNNAGMTGSMAATSPCGSAASTPTLTPSISTPVPPTLTPTLPVGGTPTGAVGTPTATVPPGSCVGDCNGSDSVEINELIIGVNIALGNTPLSTCPSFDANHSGMVEINELVTAVNNALNGCPST